MNKLFKFFKSKKCVILIEIIIAIVVFTILAAISIPPLSGYFEDAKYQQLEKETEVVFNASQTIATKLTSKSSDEIITKAITEKAILEIIKKDEKIKNEYPTLSGKISNIMVSDAKVQYIEYTVGNRVATYDGKQIKIAD